MVSPCNTMFELHEVVGMILSEKNQNQHNFHRDETWMKLCGILVDDKVF